MTFGPGLSPEEKKRRMAIINRAGLILYAALTAFILFGALIAPLML